MDRLYKPVRMVRRGFDLGEQKSTLRRCLTGVGTIPIVEVRAKVVGVRLYTIAGAWVGTTDADVWIGGSV